MAKTTGNLPIFAWGSYEKIQPAIDDGTLSYPAYVFVTEKDGETINQMAFIDKDLEILMPVEGDGVGGQKEVQRVDELPPVDEGDLDVLYIYNDIVYVFTGEDYKPMYTDTTQEVLEKVEELESEMETLSEEVEGLKEAVESVTDASSGLVFESKDEFPEIGVEDLLYIDKETGIYAWDEEKEDYVQLSDSEGTSVVFIELDDEDTDDGDDGGDDGDDGDDGGDDGGNTGNDEP